MYAIRSYYVHLAEAQALLAEVMDLEDAWVIREHLERFLTEHGMEKFIHAPVD